jgi:hypothetical protein
MDNSIIYTQVFTDKYMEIKTFDGTVQPCFKVQKTIELTSQCHLYLSIWVNLDKLHFKTLKTSQILMPIFKGINYYLSLK